MFWNIQGLSLLGKSYFVGISTNTDSQSENEDLNIGLDIDITAQKSVENTVDKNVISDLGTLITGELK